VEGGRPEEGRPCACRSALQSTWPPQECAECFSAPLSSALPRRASAVWLDIQSQSSSCDQNECGTRFQKRSGQRNSNGHATAAEHIGIGEERDLTTNLNT